MKNIFRQTVVCLLVLVGMCGAVEVTCDQGPTISLDYGTDTDNINTVCEFLYFVPLVSKTPVTQWVSADNTQSAKVISHKKVISGDSFTVTCTVEFTGAGTSKNIFDFDDMIEYKKQFFKEGETIKRILEYIELTGDSTGSIEIKGRVDGGIETVETIEIIFNRNGQSPVLISMYDLDCENGTYDENQKKNHYLARVEKLSFKRCDENPAMIVDISSIRPAKSKEGMMAALAGKVLSVFLPPMQIKQAGNDTMMNFGAAINRKEPSFIFPKAENVTEMVAMAKDTEDHPKP